jgi:hypothetical protein
MPRPNGSKAATAETVNGLRDSEQLGGQLVSTSTPASPRRRAAAPTVMPKRRRGRPTSDDHFQHAKSDGAQPRFLQIVAKPANQSKAKPQPKLTRVAFKVSRLMEFCTKRELQNQTGHGVEDWPLVVLKEVMDNSLDGCEEAEVAPVIEIAVTPRSITIQDNGGGIAAETIKSILDYTIRVSSREAYTSPPRRMALAASGAAAGAVCGLRWC